MADTFLPGLCSSALDVVDAFLPGLCSSALDVADVFLPGLCSSALDVADAFLPGLCSSALGSVGHVLVEYESFFYVLLLAGGHSSLGACGFLRKWVWLQDESVCVLLFALQMLVIGCVHAMHSNNIRMGVEIPVHIYICLYTYGCRNPSAYIYVYIRMGVEIPVHIYMFIYVWV